MQRTAVRDGSSEAPELARAERGRDRRSQRGRAASGASQHVHPHPW
jgi:hypothetical protein